MLPVAVDGLTKMPMSWLYPLLVVHRSAFPLMIAVQLAVGNTVRLNGVVEVVSMSVQLAPSLLASVYCRLLTLALRALAGISCTVRRVGEYFPLPVGQEPAPTTMLPSVDLLVFHCSFR